MGDWGDGMTVADNAEERLFLAVVRLLGECGAKYLLVRNYERYPKEFSGDVDIYVELEKVRALLPKLPTVCQESGWQLLRCVSRPWVIVLQCAQFDNPAGRPVLVFELFDRFSWLQFPYVDFDAVWSQRIYMDGLAAIPAESGIALTFAHYLFWAGFFPQKYQTNIGMACRTPDFQKMFDLVFQGSLGRRLELWMDQYSKRSDTEWEHHANIPERIATVPPHLVAEARMKIVTQLLLRNPVRGLTRLTNPVAVKLREFISIQGKILLVPAKGREVLVEVKQVHLYKNRNTVMIEVDSHNPLRLAKILFRVYWAISRGGLCIVEARQMQGVPIRVIRSLFRKHVLQPTGVSEAAAGHRVRHIIEALR